MIQFFSLLFLSLSSSLLSTYHFPLGSILCCLYSLPCLTTAPCLSSSLGSWPCCMPKASARWMFLFQKQWKKKKKRKSRSCWHITQHPEKQQQSETANRAWLSLREYGQVLLCQSTACGTQAAWRIGMWTQASLCCGPMTMYLFEDSVALFCSQAKLWANKQSFWKTGRFGLEHELKSEITWQQMTLDEGNFLMDTCYSSLQLMGVGM